MLWDSVSPYAFQADASRVDPGRSSSLFNLLWSKAILLTTPQAHSNNVYDHVRGVVGFPTGVATVPGARFDSIIGPGVDYTRNSTKERIEFSGREVLGNVDITFIALLVQDDPNTGPLVMATSSTNAGFRMGGTPGTPKFPTFTKGSVVDTTSTIQMLGGQPVMIAASYNAATNNVNFLVRHFLSGVIAVETIASTGSAVNGNGIFSVGGADFTVSTADAMIAGTYIGRLFLSLEEMRVLGNNPFGLWQTQLSFPPSMSIAAGPGGAVPKTNRFLMHGVG